MAGKEEMIHIVETAPLAIGKKEYLRWLKGNQLSIWDAVRAQCYVCMGYYQDGKVCCSVLLCPLRDFMPYNPDRVGYRKTEKQKERARQLMADINKKRTVR